MRRLWLLLLLMAAPAWAANGISSISVVKYRNLTSAAIEAFVSGDDDTTALLTIFQTIHGSGNGADTGMAMVRRTGSHTYEGRILRMSAGQTVDFYIQGIDASGGLSTPLDTVSCARVRPIVATGTVLYVSPSGLDANPGTSASPKLTVGGALTAMRALSDSGANGGIIVRPGEYHERLDLNFGVDNAPRFLMGDGTNPDSTIICGASAIVEQGFYSVGNALQWTARPCQNRAASADSVFATPFPAGDSTQLVVIGWSEMLHRKTSLLALGNDSTYIGTGTTSINSGEISGWFWTTDGSGHDTLFVKRRNGLTPSGITLHTGYRDNLCVVSRNNWHISSLTFRFAGSLTDQVAVDGTNPQNWSNRASPGERGVGIIGGNPPGNANGLVVDSCRFVGLNAGSVVLQIGAGSPNKRADSCTVTNCRVDGLTVGGMLYGAAKSRAEEGASQVIIRSYGTSCNNNFITGTFNGIGMDTGGQTDSVTAKFCEFSGNYITNTGDDAIELDNSHNINSLYFGNTMRNTASGFSICPFWSGPAFMFYNTIVQFKSKGVKACGGQTGLSRFYQNTFASTAPGDVLSPGSRAVDISPGGAVDNMAFRNNIFVSRLAGGVLYDPSSLLNTTTNTFNYNVWDSLSTTRLFNVAGVGKSLASFRTSFSWEANGSVGSIPFADSSGGRWSLTSYQARYGRRITGVNTDLQGHVINNGGGVQQAPLVGSQPCSLKPCEFGP